jgi:hypothetical protein
MRTPAKGSCLLGLGLGLGLVAAFSGRPARAADRPLLVVVEAPAALDADAAEIRRAIGTELRAETVAPMKTPTDPPERALIVALDRDRIAMSLRTNDAAPIARSIPSPPEHAARLRAIAWLAGNLARDQVSPLLAETPVTMPSLASVLPPPTLANATEPLPISASEPTVETDSPTTISRRAPDERPAGFSRWSIAASDGATTGFPLTNTNMQSYGPFQAELYNPFRGGFWRGLWGSTWRVEVQHRTKREGFFTGATLEGTAGGFTPQLVGALALVGTVKHLGGWGFEPTVGLGLELVEVQEADVTVTSTGGGAAQFMSSVSSALRPALYSDAAVAVSHPISDSLDGFLRFGLHANTVDLEYWFFSLSLGLRYNL